MFAMTSGRPSVNLKEHPEGYITDTPVAGSIQNKSKLEIEDIQLRMQNFPAIATITFAIEIVNISGHNHAKFLIETPSSIKAEIMDIDQTTTNIQKTFHIDRDSRHLSLIYEESNLQIDRQRVLIKYNGKQNIHA